MSAHAQAIDPSISHDPAVTLSEDELGEIRAVFRDGTVEQVASLLDARPALPFQRLDAGGRSHHVLELAASTGERAKIEKVLSCNPEAARGHEGVLTTLLEGRHRNERCDPAALELLVAHGAVFPTTERSDRRECWMFLERGLERCLRDDDLPLFEQLTRLGFDPMETERTYGTSIVDRALHARDHEDTALIVERLIDLGCELTESILEGSCHSGGSFEDALDCRLYDAARRMLERPAGAAISPEEALTLAAEHPELPIDLREHMLEGIDDFDAPCHGSPPIHRAVTYENSGFVEHLLSRGASLESMDDWGRTPLLHAVVERKKDIAHYLIDAGANVNYVDPDGLTVLDHARSLPAFKRTCAQLEKAGAKLGVELAPSSCGAVATLDLVRGDIEDGEPWADAFFARLTKTDGARLGHWQTLIRHCLDNNSSRPSARWLGQAAPPLEAIGDDAFRETMLDVLPKLAEPRHTACPDHWYEPSAFAERNVRLLKGLLWLCGRYTDADVCATLRQVAVIGYRKVYGIGMRNAKIANAAIVALAGMPGDSGVKELSILRATTRYNPAKVNIDRVFDKLAAERGLSPDELAEVSIPDYDLSGIGEWEGIIGDFTVRLKLSGVGKSKLTWHKGEKTQKSVPAAVKSDHADALKALKKRVREIDTATRAHARRIEQGYLSGRRHTRDEWLERLIDHRLIGHVTRRLIWQIEDGARRFSVVHDGKRLVGTDGKAANVPRAASVSLWHPSLVTVEEVVHWRRWIVERGVTQPFKQAHREVYLLTDAERATADHSLRFADHVLQHAQFHALTAQRGWQQMRGGAWDGGHENSATRALPAHALSVEFEAEGTDRYGYADTIYPYVGTGSVRFHDRHGPAELAAIDPLVFSETMRDVDLFVGVTSVANDPEWQARDVGGYWHSNAFGALGEQAKTRHAVLESLIPQLAIAGRLRLEERFLVVEGTRRTYRIHLGSSNILMTPNDQYLCIVTRRAEAPIMLPFEDDRTLSLILSKALMLADDAKIKDPVILSQIDGSA